MNKILSKLLNPKKRIAGLDIGTSSVKFMEIEGESLADAKLVSYVVEPIPREFLNHDGNIDNMQGVADIIRTCWKKSQSTTKNVVVSLSSSGIITRKATLPQLNEEDMESQIESEITNYLPEGMKLEDVRMDYYTLQPNEHTPEDADMILVAAKKEKIEEKTALVEMAGLIPQIIEVEQYSLQNMLRLMYGEKFNEKSILLLDCSAKAMKMFIFKNGQLSYSKNVEIGGDDFTHDIMNNLGIPNFVEAERLKLETVANETLAMVEKTYLMNYSTEFLRAFQYYTNIDPNPHVEEVVLTGGVAGLMGIEEAFYNIIVENNETHIKNAPFVARPLETLGKSNKINLSKLSRDEAGLFLVTSLALRHFLRQY